MSERRQTRSSTRNAATPIEAAATTGDSLAALPSEASTRGRGSRGRSRGRGGRGQAPKRTEDTTTSAASLPSTPEEPPIAPPGRTRTRKRDPSPPAQDAGHLAVPKPNAKRTKSVVCFSTISTHTLV